MHRNPPHIPGFHDRYDPRGLGRVSSPEARRARLVDEARRLARRCTLAVRALQKIDRGGQVRRGDVASRIELARNRAIDVRIAYLRAIDRLWQADASDEAMTIFREQRTGQL